AGVVRVDKIEDLFNCASILNSTQSPKKPDVAIVTNAGGPSVLATDALISRGGQLAQLSEVTTNDLNGFLPAYWSKANPVDILGDADPDRYSRTIDTVLKDDGVSGMVVIYTPQGRASPSEIANAVIAQAKQSIKPIVTTFIGDQEVSIARKLFYDNKIPTYDFPESAISTYMYMYRYARNLETLYETPADLPLDASAPSNYLRILIRNMAKKGKTLLTEAVSKKLLTTYGIASTMPYLAMNAEEAVAIAQKIGYPVVMKIASSTIIHKSDSGGVVLNITSATGVKKAFEKIMGNSLKVASREEIEGITIQQMITNYDYELIMGSTKDSLLGPILMFGLGGREAEFFKDLSVGVPPLNQALARRMLEQTKVYKMLSQGFRGKKPVNLLLLDETLVRLSTLIVDFPEIKELDINPLVVTGNGVVALDARVVVDKTVVSNNAILQHTHLIISPYPTKYIQNWICRDGKQVLLRAIKPEDEPMEKELIAALSEESSRFRFFYILKDISHEMLSRFCNIDYEREMAIVAEYNIEGKHRIVGVGRLITESGNETGEFAVLVSDDFQSNGLGVKLLDILIGIGKEKQLGSIYGIVLSDNLKMLGLARKMGFGEEVLSEEETKVVLEL
ncbi:MAG: GNAT family N-acetyltransferase, partial [Chloroflexi bacterium]|nr:GNAT family N-acetyltransferase [Chloroflexota bacterium]